jgi:hypothetical protein
MLGILAALLSGRWILYTQTWGWWHFFLALCSVMMLFFYQQRKKSIIVDDQLQHRHPQLWKIPKTWKVRQCLSIAILSAFSYVTYALVFQFFPAWLPLFSKYLFKDLFSESIFLMGIDLALIFFLPRLFKKFETFLILYWTLLGFAITCIPLLIVVFLYPFLFYGVRMLWMFAGVFYAIHFMVFLKQNIQGPFRYLEIGLWSLIGSAIGHTTTFLCLWLFQKTHHILGSGLYLMLISLGAWYALCFLKRSP